MSRRRGALCAGLLALGAAQAAAPEPPRLDAVTVEARVEAGAPASVSMSYLLRPAGAPSVAFGSIRLGELRAANVRAFVGNREVSFRTEPGRDSRVDGRVELPAWAAAAERLRLRLLYEVLPETAPDLDSARGTRVVALPLLVAAWPPAEALPETFQATVHLPPGTVAVAAFPSAFERVETVDRTSGANAYRFTLPVVPALIRIRTTAGEPSLLTPERAVDAGAVGLLAALAILGWRRLAETLR